jgi:hypothetical protein
VERDGVRRRARLGYRSDRRAVLTAAGCALVLAGWVLLMTGCSSAKATSDAGATCGTTRTAANVPVIIKIAKGSVNCGTALQVENQYAAKIRDGQVRGNGGGAPVTVSGWTCQGYNTPEVLSTGNASQCHTSGAAILAVLPVPVPETTAA